MLFVSHSTLGNCEDCPIYKIARVLTCLRMDVFRPNDDSNEVEVRGSSTIDSVLLLLYYNFSYFVSRIFNHCQICFNATIFSRFVK